MKWGILIMNRKYTYNERLWNELLEICNYDLDEVKDTIEFLKDKYDEEKYYQDNKEDNKEEIDKATMDDIRYKEKKEMEN